MTRIGWIAIAAIVVQVGRACGEMGAIGNGSHTSPDTGKTVAPGSSQVAFWLTNMDRSVLFQQQNVALNFSPGHATQPVIVVDTTSRYQTMDGFGYCLTGGSAQLIYGLPAATRQALERELFTSDSTHIGVSYLRLTIGASDMSARVFSYDDDASPAQPDTGLAHFTLADDTLYLLPLLKEILAVDPSITILGSPWSPPAWMKTNDGT
ncbi:MAG TPA: glucosylceramidase, partial [Puia sp.]|nr:glucosylceramidase [Puia sp.]